MTWPDGYIWMVARHRATKLVSGSIGAVRVPHTSYGLPPSPTTKLN